MLQARLLGDGMRRRPLFPHRYRPLTESIPNPRTPEKMTPSKTNPIPTSRILIRWLCTLSLTLGTLLAQSANTGIITGRVFDERTGKSLEGAVVRVVGTNAIDYTGSDGRYSVTAPAGTPTIQIEYVGLDSVQQSVPVAAGQSATFNAPLKSSVLQLDSFVVQESVRGQSLAINMQKVAAGIVNIVSEETFGQMIDGNIGTALQRLPGISVNEENDGSTEGINIRGISGDYNSVQIDGNRAPNPGGTSRAFDAKQLMADGVTNIEVIKAPTPDRDGDAIGGIINVISRNAYQRDGRDFKLKLGGVYSDLPKKWGHQASLQYNDLFSILGKEKNLGISATVSSYETNRYSRNADMDWVQVTKANNPQLNLDQYGDYPVWFFEATHFEYDTRVTSTYGISGSIDFRTDEHNSFYVRPLYSHFDRAGTTFETDMDIDTRFQDQVGGRKTYAFLTHDSGGAAPGNNGSRGSRGWIGTDEDNKNDLYSVAFGGRHEKPGSLLTYDFFYSWSKQVVAAANELNTLMEPTDPWIVQEYKIHRIHEGAVEVKVTNGVDISNINLMTEGELIQVSSVKEEEIYSGRLDWEKKFARENGVFTFKTGAKYRMSKPKYNRTEVRHDLDEDFPYERVMEPTNEFFMLKPKIFDVYPSRGVALLRTNSEVFDFNLNTTTEGSNLRDYNAEESTNAAYVMGTYRFGAHSILAGVRFEENKWKSQRTRVGYVGGVPTPRRDDIENSYDFWLPGVHLRHELRKNLIMRESFNQSYGRPSLSQLTLGRVVATNGNITDGNPNLRPVTADNYDWQIEFYTANSGLYSVGVFYKDVKDFSFQLDSRFEVVDANGEPVIIPGATSGLRYRRVQNGASAKQYGVELIARQRLTFLPGMFKGFTASASATFSESEADYPQRSIALGGDGRTGLPLPGFSPYLFTASLEYARGRFHTRLDYRYRDDYVEGLGANIESDEFYSGEERVDAEISYEIRKGLSVYASGTNLTERWQVSYQGFKQFVEDASFAGRKITVGMEYKF
jgi:TonB-dependent receptor